MSDESHPLRRIAWRDVCPWLIIFKAFGLSTTLVMLGLSTIATLAVPLGWAVADLLFHPPLLEKAPAANAVTEILFHGRRWPGSAPADLYEVPTSLEQVAVQVAVPVRNFGTRFLAGWRYVLDPPASARDLAFLLFCALWALLVWSIFAGAITRIAVVYLGREERVGPVAAVRHAARRVLSYVGAPLLPLAAILLGLLGMALLGWLMPSSFGLVLAALLWPLVLLGSLFCILLLIGLVFGWPFMWVAIGAEVDADAWDAISRGYTYALQRPLRFLFYALLALVHGTLGWLLVYHTAELVLAFCRNAVMWAGGHETLLPLFVSLDEVGESGLPLVGWLVRLGNGFVRTVAVSYGYSYFFCAVSAIYLVLRYDIEQTEFDEVFLSEEDESLRLPAIPSPPVTGSTVPAASAESANPDKPSGTAEESD